MALMDLYDGDMSLFGGDVLASLELPSVGELPDFSQDITPWVEDTKCAEGGAMLAPLPSPLQNTARLEMTSTSSTMDPQFDAQSSWLETQVDLLELLCNVDTTNGSSTGLDKPVMVIDIAPMDSSFSSQEDEKQGTALEILQSMAEETDRELASAAALEQSTAIIQPVVTDMETPYSTVGDKLPGSSTLLSMLLSDEHDSTRPSDENLTIARPTDLGLDIELSPELVLEASSQRVLSPVSPEDVESILSSGPCSPELPSSEYAPMDHSSASSSSSEDDPVWEPVQKKQARSKRQSKSTPYRPRLSKEEKERERKQRKKQQNRDAALRYRTKKREEAGNINQECEKLEQRNKELHEQVDQMTREIQYLKDLMSEVYTARIKSKASK